MSNKQFQMNSSEDFSSERMPFFLEVTQSLSIIIIQAIYNSKDVKASLILLSITADCAAVLIPSHRHARRCFSDEIKFRLRKKGHRNNKSVFVELLNDGLLRSERFWISKNVPRGSAILRDRFANGNKLCCANDFAETFLIMSLFRGFSRTPQHDNES